MARRPAQYDFSAYRDDGTLRVSALIIAMTLFLGRHLLLIFVGGISTFKGAKVSGIPGLYSHPLLLVASVPALLVLISMFRRVPTGGELPRKIWHAGRWLLCIAAMLDIALALVIADFRADRISPIQVATFVVDAYIVLYLFRSERARDTFADFPARREPGGAARSDSETPE